MNETIEKLIKRIQWIGAWKESDLNYFFQEVNDDINFLEEFKKEYGNQKEGIIQIHQSDPKVQIRNFLKKKYGKEYCPASTFPRAFTNSQKIKYLMMRVEIDKLLNINNINYQI